MRHLTSGVLAWALIVGCLASDAAHSQTKPTNKVDTGTVSGRITVKGKGMPGIVVSLRSGESDQRTRSASKATTDEDGKYRITNVPPGTYNLAPIAPTFVLFDSSSSGSPGKTLVINEGEVVEGFDFALIRGGVITGKVTDAEGQPVVEEIVNLAMENQANSLPPGVESAQTDDRGIYRIFGVPPGHYRVSAGMGDEGFYGGGRGRIKYRRTFYPATTDRAQATVVEVAEATESTNVDIILVRMVKGVSASGRVVDSKNGEPVPSVPLDLTKVTVEGNSTNHSGGMIRSTNTKGEFEAEALTPGRYIVTLSQQRENLRADPVTFDVLDQDVTGLLIKTSAGGVLDGVVIIQGAPQSSSLPRFAPLFISAFVRDESPRGGVGRYAPVSPDGSFRILGLEAGTVHLALGGPAIGRGRGVVISRIERNGVEQADGIQIQKGEQVTGLRVFLTHGAGTIRGKVTIENGPLPSDVRFFVSLVKIGEQPNGTAPEVDARGHFIADGLTSGSYEITGTVYMPRADLKALSSKKLVTVADGVVSEVTITIDLNQNPRRTP